MHLNKCRKWATFGQLLCVHLLVLSLVASARPGALANIENKQHEQSTRLAHPTLRANKTRNAIGQPSPVLAASKRQINNVNSGRTTKAGPSSSPSPLPLPPPSNNNQSSQRLISKYKLPSWFHFNTFKQLYGKKYPGGHTDELHKRIYLRTSLKVFEQRALYRSGRLDSLASVNELSDLTGEQLDQFRALRKNSSSSTSEEGTRQEPIKAPLPECCTYDQVYARIIGLLSAATSANDSALSRALMDELEQKPLVESDPRDEWASPDLGPPNGNHERPAAPPPARLAKSTRRAPSENKANIDDKREHMMIERRHRDEDDEAKELQRRRAQQQQQLSGHRKGLVAKSNLAPDHQTNASAASGGRLRYDRPAAAASASLGSNRSTTSTDSGNTQPTLAGQHKPAASAHSGPADDEDELGVPKEIEEAVRAQVAEQLSSSSPLGRELSKQMSAYFGRPVEIRAVPATASQTAHSKSGPLGR